MKEMTCREFDETVHGLVRVELLDVTVREAALDHALRCRNCAERMEEATTLAEASEAACRDVREQQTPPGVETFVLTAFRNHHRRAAWRRSFEWIGIGAAAAIALAFMWTVRGSSKGQTTPPPRKDVSSQSVGILDAQGSVSSSPVEIAPPTQADEAKAVTGETFVANDFVPLPFADEIGPEDLGMVVRVQVSRASLAELGYPVIDTPDPDEDLISADVLVGEDGWPRAVRLVQ